MAPAAPSPGSAEDLLARITERVKSSTSRRGLLVDDNWLYLRNPDMPILEHGWKLHISARPEQLPELVDLVLPVLLRHTCDAKFAAGAPMLRSMNSGVRSAAAVGKAVTVYPAPEALVTVGLELAAALAGRPGPRVVSDRRLRPDAPVYYRYGPFHVADGDTEPVITGPDGATFSGAATERYRQPAWVTDPFGHQEAPAGGSVQLGDGRYRITAGITRSPNGHVYRAVETTTGRTVVIKQARAFVAEDSDGVDARGRLRHERQVLSALAGLPEVPELVDHFRHGEDEYLVTGDRGPRDLRRDVLTRGPYRAVADAERDEWRWRATCYGCWTQYMRAGWWSATSSRPMSYSTTRAGVRWWTSASAHWPANGLKGPPRAMRYRVIIPSNSPTTTTPWGLPCTMRSPVWIPWYSTRIRP